MSTKPELVPEAEPVDETIETLTLRGKRYVIRELLAEEYEDVVKAATPPPNEAGEIPDTDMLLLRKLLVLESTTEDGKPLTIDRVKKLHQPVYAKLDAVARRHHWGEIESDEEAAERQAKAQEASGLPSR